MAPQHSDEQGASTESSTVAPATTSVASLDPSRQPLPEQVETGTGTGKTPSLPAATTSVAALNIEINKENAYEENNKKDEELVQFRSLDSIGWLSNLTFSWFWQVLRDGHRHQIQHSQLSKLRDRDDPALLYDRFIGFWEAEKKRAQARLEKKNAKLLAANKPPHKLSDEVNMLYVMIQTVGWGNLVVAFTVSIFQNIFNVVTPFMSKWLIESLSETSDVTGKQQAGYAVGLIVLPLAASLCQAQANYISKRGSQHLFAVFTQAIFNKSLHLSSASRNESSSGQIVNLMSTDAGTAMERAILLIYPLFLAPPIIAILLYLLYREIGISAYAGLGSLFVVLPISIRVFVALMQVYKKIIVFTDERIKLCNEAFQAIRILKMYAWEKPFMAKILAVRAKELGHLMHHAYLFAIGMNAVFLQLPFFIQFFSFTAYYLLGNEFYPWSIFTAIQLLQVLRQSFTQLPSAVTQLSQTLVAQRRIKHFLLLPELDQGHAVIQDLDLALGEMILDDVSFDWGEGVALLEAKGKKGKGKEKAGKKSRRRNKIEEDHDSPTSGNETANEGENQPSEPKGPVLHNITLNIRAGSQCAIISAVGAGKSSLLAGMIGELEVTSGHVRSNGTVAYAPQQPWIISATIRDNILFGREFNATRYKQVINACSLRTDLKLFPDGDMAYIGERGLNLSGGQKARISLARAVYADADILLLDNPLSAVDSHVGAAIFKNCIKGPLLKGKTLIWVTNQLDKIPGVDHIVILHGGSIAAQGPYLDMKGEIERYMRSNYTNAPDENVHPGDAESSENSEILEVSSSFVSIPVKSDADPSSLPGNTVLNNNAAQEHDDQDEAMTTMEEIAEVSENETVRLASAITSGSLDQQILSEGEALTNNPLYAKEQEAMGTLKFSVLVWFVKASGQVLFTSSYSLYILYLFTPVFSQYVLQWWTDEELTCYVSGPPCQGKGDWFWYSMYLMLVVLGIGMVVVAGFFIARARINASKNIHNDLLEATFSSGITDFFDVVPLGRILNRFSKDITTIDVNLSQMLMFGIATLGFTLAAFIGLLLGTSGLFAIVIVPIVGAYALVYRYTRKTAIQLQRLESTSRSPIYSQFSEVLNGLKTVRAFQQESRFRQRNRTILDANMRAFYLVRVVLPSWLMVAVNIFGIFITGFTTIFILTTDFIAAGQAALALTYAITITQTLNATTMVNTEMEVMMNSVERIKKTINESIIEDPLLRIEDDNNQSANPIRVHIANEGAQQQWPGAGKIEITDLVLGYRDGPDVLHGVTITIEPGEKIGVCGRTGSGKSTLLSALLRIVEPRAGKISIDGVDIRSITLEQLRSRLAIIPQDPVCFIGSIRLNLDPFENHGDDEINECLRQVQLEQWVGKLDFQVAEGGENISVGQRQMICFGRAILRRTKVLLVDEATAHLDAGTDDLIQKMVREVFHDRTTITIAHRLPTILDSTRILVMDNGLVGEFDTPEALTSDPNSRLSLMLAAEKSKKN